jgi:hypothetical protein
VESLGEVVPILATASRAERATTRADRGMALRHQEAHGRPARIELEDGLAITRAQLEHLTTCHRTEYHKLDWRPLAARQPVAMPVRTHDHEKTARHALGTWQPTWQERMFGDEAHRRRDLTNRVHEAQHEDEVAFQKASRAAQTYNVETLIARKLFELDPRAIRDAVTMKTALAELRDGVNSIGVILPGPGRVIAVVEAIQEGDVPYERVTEGEPRTARREPISAVDRRQIHLAALCAAGLRVGAELLSVLPVEALDVAVLCETSAAGGERPTVQPVIQLHMTAKALTEHDWKKEDAVTLATTLGARMDWSIEKGFAPIRLIQMSAADKPLARSA